MTRTTATTRSRATIAQAARAWRGKCGPRTARCDDAGRARKQICAGPRSRFVPSGRADGAIATAWVGVQAAGADPDRHELDHHVAFGDFVVDLELRVERRL